MALNISVAGFAKLVYDVTQYIMYTPADAFSGAKAFINTNQGISS